MRLQFIGSGDAFGSGGRFNTCFHVTGDKVNFLIDCGASSLIGLKTNEISLNEAIGPGSRCKGQNVDLSYFETNAVADFGPFGRVAGSSTGGAR